jgi:hypothetical protein
MLSASLWSWPCRSRVPEMLDETGVQAGDDGLAADQPVVVSDR